jgi:1,4-dihydroxy-2-naphthoyl-CoA synthase
LIGGVHEFVGPYALVYVACCDFTIAAAGTRFSCEMLRVGSQHPYGPWSLLYMQLPMRVVSKLFLMAGWMDADEALQHQFVQRVVDPEELETETRRWALEAAKMSSPPVRRVEARDQEDLRDLGSELDATGRWAGDGA